MITKFTSGVRVLEPLALLGGSYLAYVTAELFHWYSLLFSPFWFNLTPTLHTSLQNSFTGILSFFAALLPVGRAFIFSRFGGF